MQDTISSVSPTAIVLAAGLSRRMGRQNKMLYAHEDKPMLLCVLDALRASAVKHIIVVLGHEASIVAPIIPNSPKIEITINQDYEEGMSSSIRKGASALAQGCTHSLIVLGDMPYLTSDDFNYLLSTLTHTTSAEIIIPRYEQSEGHPVIFSHHFFEELMALNNRDRGAKSIIKNHPASVKYFQFPNNHILQDIDEPIN